MTILQLFAVLVRDSLPESRVSNITDRYLNMLRTEHLQEVWEDGKIAMRKTFDFLHNHVRLPGPALVPNRYYYMTLASYFFRNPAPDYELLWRYFWYYSFQNDDLLRNTSHLRDHVTRFRTVREGGDFGFERFQINRDRLRLATYSYRGRLARAMLALYANQDPRDWANPERSVLSDVYYMITDRPNLHHIFPKDFCESRLGEHGRYADSMLNIAYLRQITNLQIGNKNPLEYMRDYLGPQFPKIQETHLLPDVLLEWVESTEMPDDALDLFVEARLDLILGRLEQYLSGIPFEVIDTRSAETSTLDA